MITPNQVRHLALAHDGVTEHRDRGRPAFRIGDRTFASLPDDQHLSLIVSWQDVFDAGAHRPEVYRELWWDDCLVGLRISLHDADHDHLVPLLVEACRQAAEAAEAAAELAAVRAAAPKNSRASARAAALATFRSAIRLEEPADGVSALRPLPVPRDADRQRRSA